MQEHLKNITFECDNCTAGPESLWNFFQKVALLGQNLAQYRRTKDLVPLFDPKMTLFRK